MCQHSYSVSYYILWSPSFRGNPSPQVWPWALSKSTCGSAMSESWPSRLTWCAGSRSTLKRAPWGSLQWRWLPLLQHRGRDLITGLGHRSHACTTFLTVVKPGSMSSPFAETPPSLTIRPATPPTTASTRTCQSPITEIRKWRTGAHQLFSSPFLRNFPHRLLSDIEFSNVPSLLSGSVLFTLRS